jgi:hypothetical protein
VWRHRLLGTEATYRVVELQGDGLVRVRVIQAPGLPKGFELSLSEDALLAMEPVVAPSGEGTDSRSATRPGPVVRPTRKAS